MVQLAATTLWNSTYGHGDAVSGIWNAHHHAFQTQYHLTLPRQVSEEIQNLDLSAWRTLNRSIPFFKLLGKKDKWFVE